MTVRHAAAYPLLLAVALLITWSLFFLVYRLTVFEGAAEVGEPKVFPIDFVEVARELPEEPEPLPEKPKPQAARPQIPSIQKFSPPIQPAHLSADGALLSNLTGLLTGLPEPGIGGEATPIVRVSPIYPVSAASRGVEGRVRIVFAINEEGWVESPEVIESEPSAIFNRSALRAVSKWRYRPQITDGRAQRREGVEVIIEFRLDQ